MQSAACCTSCRKIVYPTERLSVLNQIFHKSCFRCSSCRAALSLRSFTTVEGVPFCVAHAPSLRPSPVVDTPEIKLAARAQQLASKNQYQKDFQQDIKGKVLTVADDLETLRVKKTGAVISDVQYQGTLRRKRDMDAKRHSSDIVKQNSVEFEGTTALLYSAVDGRPVTFVGKSNQRPIGSIHDYNPYQDEEEPPLFTKTTYVTGQTNTNGWERVANLKNGQDSKPVKKREGSCGHKPRSRTGKMYRAVYTYRAEEDDEVSFDEGDYLLGCNIVNSGWMTCTVLRNGRRGMVPANFIEPV